MAVHIKKIDFRNTGIRIAVTALLAGTLLGLYHRFSRTPEVTPPASPKPDSITSHSIQPPAEPEQKGEETLKLRLSADTLAVKRRPPVRTGKMSLHLSIGTQPAPSPAPATWPLTGHTPPLRLSITEQISAIPDDSAFGLELDASPKLTAAPPGPSPRPDETAPRDNAPVLPTPERNGPRRPTVLAGSQPPQSDPPPDSDSAGATPLAAFGWAIPPIRWGGQVGLQMSQNHNSSGANSSDIAEFLNLNASSYIYQPWFAQINGNLSLSTSQSKSSSGSQADSTSSTESISGGGQLNLFPLSRFPALLTYDVSDSNSTSNLTGTDSTTTRFGIRQSYRPESGAYNVSAGYNTSTISSSTQGDDRVDALSGSFSTRFNAQSLSANTNFSESTGNRTGQSSSLLNLNVFHNWRARDNLLVDSLATVNDNTQTFLSGGGSLSENHGRTMQLNSNVNWHPEEDEDGNIIPLNVNGGMRATTFQNDSPGSSTSTQSLSANAAASYNYSSNLSLSGNALATQVSSSASNSQVFTLLGAGANYTGDPLTFGNFSYNWNAGANGSQQSGGGSSDLTLTEQFGHNLNRAIALSKTSSMGLSFGQNASHSSSEQSGNTASLSHNASASYNTAFSDRASGNAGLNLSDTITAGANPSHYTNLNLDTRGQIQFNTLSSGSISMTLQHAINDTSSLGASDNRTAVTNIFGSASYQHARAFGVPRLRYNASLSANTTSSSSDERLAGNVNSANEDINYAIDNRFNYRIGLLDFQLRGTINSVAGQENATVFFRVTRDLGGF